ncbi:MAG TPA: hypothetical protein VMH85_03310 [Terriglobales bacterium]|nr:hypothetical protein [Terriglobales bacterium]
MVHLVTSEAGNGWLFREFWVAQCPRTFGVEWCHQVTNSAVEVHCVTAQAIIHQVLLVIVVIVQKYLSVSDGVGSRSPIRKLLLMACPATVAHAQHILVLKSHLFGYLTAQVGRQAMHVLEVKT